MTKEPIRLRYVGGDKFIPGVPAADHEVETVAEAKQLCASGLYRVAKPPRAPSKQESSAKQENPDG